MVIQLVKRELRDSSRSFVPVLISIILGSVLLPLQLRILSSSFLSAIINFVFVILMFTIIYLSIKASFYILYTNLYNRSGYELFTLPVKLWEIIASKLITLWIWGVLISIVSVVAFFMFAVLLSGEFQLILQVLLEGVRDVLPYLWTGDAWLVILNMSVSSIQFSILVFFAGAIANSSFFTRNRAWWAFLFVFLISWLVGIFSGAIGLEAGGLNFLMADTGISVDIDQAQIWFTTLFNITLCGLYFFGALWFWDNKLEVMN